ncbi:hypothetical protein Clacol_007879 [Clathrus columnatus]|uniref:Terpenoid synthase n=1 Tax=Clathrus columnatus TaxID=1419009 RepID=A0AAV5AJC8_9AGAM|nr:hypothetical protein Clacol_007879 [Clathrus columnatus]
MSTALLSRYLLNDQQKSISLMRSPPEVGGENSDPFELIRYIIRNFVRHASRYGSLHFDPPPTDELEAKVLNKIKELNIDLLSVQRWLTWSCQVAEGLYPFHPTDLKVLIVICNLVIFHIDDTLAKTPEVLHTFQPNLLNGISQSDPILECLSKVLIPRMWKYYHPLAANEIAIGFYEFIQDGIYTLAPEFPEYVRLKSDASAQYAYWLFYHPDRPDVSPYLQGIPDFLKVINRVNDILSFYMEELAGENDNFVHMRAKLSGKGVVAALHEICEETLTLHYRHLVRNT